MAQDWYVGIGGKARRIVKAYIGVGGKAREIVAGYVGVGGKARQFWSGGELKFKGEIAVPRRPYNTGVGLDSHAIFSGAPSSASSYENTYTDAYNKNLVCSSISGRTQYVYEDSSARAGNYALFAGGQGTRSEAPKTVDVYNDSLVKTVATDLRTGIVDGGGASAGSVAVFTCGNKSEDSSLKGDVDFYDANLVHSTASLASEDMRSRIASLSVGNYALFAGGDPSGSTSSASKVNAYNSSHVMTKIYLSESTYSPVSTNVGKKYGVVGGGRRTSSSRNAVNDAINTNLTITKLSDFEEFPRDDFVGASAGNYGVLPLEYSHCYIYDSNLVRTYITNNSMDFGVYAVSTSLGRTAIIVTGAPTAAYAFQG